MPLEEFQLEGHRVCKWTHGNSSYLAMPEQAARLMNWHVQMADGSVRDVIYWPDNPNYSAPGDIPGGIIPLFPFAGNCQADGQEERWKWKGHRWPMPQDGFARTQNFTVSQIDENGFTAELTSNEAIADYYPFDFQLSIRYRFRPLVLEAEMTLENTGRKPIPWCPGFLPYFQLPWLSDTTASDYQLDIPANKIWKQNDNGDLKTDNVTRSDYGLADTALNQRIHSHLDKSEARIYAKDHKKDSLTIKIGSELIPKEDISVTTRPSQNGEPYFCLQPSSGPPNAPAHERGLQAISARQTAIFAMAVKLY